MTIHKEQGKTEDRLVVACKSTFRDGQFYTAISRTKTLAGLYIVGKVESKQVKVNKESLSEMKRLHNVATFSPEESIIPLLCPESYFKIAFHNTNSLKPH